MWCWGSCRWEARDKDRGQKLPLSYLTATEKRRAGSRATSACFSTSPRALTSPARLIAPCKPQHAPHNSPKQSQLLTGLGIKHKTQKHNLGTPKSLRHLISSPSSQLLSFDKGLIDASSSPALSPADSRCIPRRRSPRSRAVRLDAVTVLGCLLK